LQDVQDLDQGPAVFAAGEADHDAVAVFDEVEVDNRLGRFLGEARLEGRPVWHPTIILSLTQ
jgi:hypothetical protein